MQKMIIVFSFLTLLLWSCKKDPKITEDPVITGSVDFNVTNVVGSVPLALSTQTYVNENLDTFNVNLFKYYISNIKLFRIDGYVYSETESYHLLNQNDTNSCKFRLQNIPTGEYIGMQFIIGVDSLRNCSGAQSGALDIINDMFWDWSQGYIFAKLEGTSNQAVGGSFLHHVGGFTGLYNAIVKANPTFSSAILKVSEENPSKIYMKADVLEWFKNPTTIDLASYSGVGGGKKSAEIATNYSDMFSVAAIKN